MKLSKNKKCCFVIFCSICIIAILTFTIIRIYAFKISRTEKKLSSYNVNIFNTGCIIKTFGKGSKTVSASISFYTPRGNLIGSYERGWQGSELNMECIVFKFKDGAITFPYRIFSDTTDGTGTILFNMYTENNYPAIYDYPFFPAEEKTLIKKLFNLSVFSPYLITLFSSAKIKTVTIQIFKPDAEYSLNILPSGEIILAQI